MGGAALAAAAAFPDEVWEHVFSFLTADGDRNAISLVCRAWQRIERFSRRRIFVGNCYAVWPGKPHFADFNLVPQDWGGDAYNWVAALAVGCPLLEELRLKRMVVSDECLELVAKSFCNFKVLGLATCEGFTTSGLATIAANCRHLEELDLQENEVEDHGGQWLSYFPESSTSLVCLNMACLEGPVSAPALERLLSRCTRLRTLRLSKATPLEKLPDVVRLAPQLADLGTGRFHADTGAGAELYPKLEAAFAGCRALRGLSGVWEAAPAYLPAVYPICEGLTSLNLSYATVQSPDLIKLVGRCRNLQKLLAVAASCKLLQELRVFPSDPYAQAPQAQAVSLTESGLVAVAAGCPRLHSVLYFPAGTGAVPPVHHGAQGPDYATLQPLDAGFGAIVQSCRGLRRLSLSGLLTDRVFEAIGADAQRLEMLSVAFAGESDAGLHHGLPFGDGALLENAAKLETMRSLWMSSCMVTLGACKALARRMPRLCVEPRDSWPDDAIVDKLYVYRTLASPRPDAPDCVWIL
ncbi:unnamed protein product [Spirodela intermedia]|uniref:F-box domain-containing protein n=1 Tax=Spirodela intermedia TaxID=51605 RepID=A0A7I8I999_SPIIN|nr:unnamed protein product [Spirodela intermedia]CAA6654219.1 unnamed protein product [Spirodela intermedia]